jgi:predicted nucleic acid-binding Zn finger protein
VQGGVSFGLAAGAVVSLFCCAGRVSFGLAITLLLYVGRHDTYIVTYNYCFAYSMCILF